MTEETDRYGTARDPKGRFGEGNPGRPKGARNKLGEAFVAALEADFNEHGVEAIKACREVDPTAYVRTIAGLLPKQVHITENPLSDMGDDELKRLLDIIRAADSAAVSARNGTPTTNGTGKPH